ncbi:MAG TPA: hypothetical protein VGG39_29890 [Polyangiaceae bacterium]|jgi:hypothetical protein
MRAFQTKVLALGVATIAASAAWGSSGCSSKKPTEIVPGALTQVQVPKDLQGITVNVTANGEQKFCESYAVENGSVLLPATLGVLSGSSNETLRITIRGYDDITSPDYQNCGQTNVDDPNPSGGGPSPRVLRQAILTYVDAQTLFLPMPLSFSCYDKDCSGNGGDSTCAANQCVDANIDPKTLAPFNPALVDGTQDCFDASDCMSPSHTVAADAVDPVNCIYQVPQPDPSNPNPTSTFNVRLTYTDYAWTTDPGTGSTVAQAGNPVETEILNLDANEGYTIPDSTKPNQFQLAPGLCALVQAAANVPPAAPGSTPYHTVSNVDVAPGCAQKSPLLPFCAGQQHGNVQNTTPQVACGVAVPLSPAPSAIYMVMDDSGSMYGAYGANGALTALNLSFASPLFERTAIAFSFFDHGDPAVCSAGAATPYANPTIPFGSAQSVQQLVAGKLGSWVAPDTSIAPDGLYLHEAMKATGGAYQAVEQFVQKTNPDGGQGGRFATAAVMFFVNRIPVAGAGGSDGGASDAGAGGDYSQDAAECTPSGSNTVQQQVLADVQAAFGNGVKTYFVVLNDKQLNPAQVLTFYNGVASASNGAAAVIDVSNPSALSVFDSFLGSIVTATQCTYDLPAGVDTTATLDYQIPGNLPPVNPGAYPGPSLIASNANCNAGNQSSPTSSGWNIDNGRIVLCGTACSGIQGIIGLSVAASLAPTGDAGTDAGLTTVDGGPLGIPDIPVTASMPCTTDQ